MPAAAAGKKTYLWIGATDGRVKVFVNGKHVPYVDAKGEKAGHVRGLLPAGVVRHLAALQDGRESDQPVLYARDGE